MAKFVPLRKDDHANRAWVRPANYAFAAKDAAVPIVGIEAAAAAVNMPLAFVKQQNLTVLVAITGPTAGENFFVARDGRWLGAYIPAVLRAYPFRLVRVEGRNDMALCIEEGSLASTGEPIYDDEGNLTQLVKNSVTMLEIHERSAQQTMMAAAALAEAGVLVPWPIKFKSGKDQEATMKGVLKVDEQALAKLDDAAFLKLRKVGALPLAYAQLISMTRLPTLSRMAEMREKLAAAASQQKPQSSKLDFLRVEDGNIVF